MPGQRRQARIAAMQALCQWDVQQDESPVALAAFLSSLQIPDASVTYAAWAVKSFWAQRESVDQRISSASTKWSISRISAVERNAMRVAVTEMLGDEVPPRVAIDEAIEIGREFGGGDSPRFINGVLDAVLKGIQHDKQEDGG